MSSAERQPFCLCLSVFTTQPLINPMCAILARLVLKNSWEIKQVNGQVMWSAAKLIAFEYIVNSSPAWT